MGMAARIRRAPGRLATGAFILNSGLGKLNGTEDTAKAVHGMAVGAYPALARIEPTTFLKLLAVGELTIGGALLVPVVPPVAAGAALTGFAGSLLGMWWRTPGMHLPGSVRPTQPGTAIAKDIWMLAIGVGLVVDAVLSRD
jgi:uncharacterized membrane protein YphA (DoxX/SURF4 family)